MLERFHLLAGLKTSGVPQNKLEKVPGERNTWASVLRLLSPQPSPGYVEKIDGWTDRQMDPG